MCGSLMSSKKNDKFFYSILNTFMRYPVLQKIRVLFYFFDSVVLLLLKKPKQIQMEKKKLLIVFPLAFGDAIMFLGSLKNIRTLYPQNEFEIHLTCQKQYEDLFTDFVDVVIPMDFRLASSSPKYRVDFCKKFRETYYDVVIDPVGCNVCSPNIFVVNATCAKQKFGACATDIGTECPKWMINKIYDKVIYHEDGNLHRNKYYAKILSKFSKVEIQPDLASLKVEKTLDLPDKYIVIYPAASTPLKRWPVERFIELAKRVHSKSNLPIVVCGTAVDAEVTNDFLKGIPGIPTYNYLGKTTCNQMIEIISRASFVITNDTSTYHISVALQQDTCIISGAYLYDQFVYYNCSEYGCKEPIVASKNKECKNCNFECKYSFDNVYPCLDEIEVDDVWNLIKNKF